MKRVLCGIAAVHATADWTSVDNLVNAAIAAQVTPGAAVGVLDSKGNIAFAKAYGNAVYSGQTAPIGNGNPPVTLNNTWFDMASCTKIMGGTTAAAVLYQAGLLDLSMPVADPTLLGPVYAAQGKSTIQVRDLLMHQAGYPPDPVPNYNLPEFGCPSAFQPYPVLTYSCSERIFTALLNQTLQYEPRTAWLYSDLR
jgi:CubicO group peptidase (beta-lactamase class C family)